MYSKTEGLLLKIMQMWWWPFSTDVVQTCASAFVYCNRKNFIAGKWAPLFFGCPFGTHHPISHLTPHSTAGLPGSLLQVKNLKGIMATSYYDDGLPVLCYGNPLPAGRRSHPGITLSATSGRNSLT